MFHLRRIALALLISQGLCTSLGFNRADAAIRVVSDIDDTAKITNIESQIASKWNALFYSKAFTGMKELYSVFSVSREYEFHYLTAAPKALRSRVSRFLTVNAFPEGEIHLRPIGFESVKEYKVRVLQEIMERHPQDSFILIGDDTQVDAAAYDEVYRMDSSRILAIYIRKVRNVPLPPSVYPFTTAFDVALYEGSMKRMEPWEAAPVAFSILAEKRDERVLPDFAHCPSLSFSDFKFKPSKGEQGLPEFNAPQPDRWSKSIRARVQSICKARERTAAAVFESRATELKASSGTR
jgi:hypothetical protein